MRSVMLQINEYDDDMMMCKNLKPIMRNVLLIDIVFI